MDKIVFTLNNTGNDHIYYSTLFNFFNRFLQNPDEVAQRFMEELDAFSYDEFCTLKQQVSIDKEKKVNLNEEQIVIYYAAIHFVCWAFVNEAQENFLLEHVTQEQKVIFKSAQLKVLDYGREEMEEINQHFASNAKVTATFKKIAAIDMDEL